MASPATPSARASGGRSGGPSGSPFSAAKPLIASASVPKPGRAAYGPDWPKPVTRASTSRGLAAESSSQPSPHRSSVPGRKFSSTTSVFGQAQEELGARGPGEVERREALVAGERLEPEPDAVLARPVPARGIGPGGVLELDHLRAVVAQEHSGERRREERRRLDDPDPRERLGGHGRSTAKRKPIEDEPPTPRPVRSSLRE